MKSERGHLIDFEPAELMGRGQAAREAPEAPQQPSQALAGRLAPGDREPETIRRLKAETWLMSLRAGRIVELAACDSVTCRSTSSA